MTDPLFVQTDGVRNFSQIHSDVRSGLAGLTAPEGSGVNTSHGTIAASVSSALGSVLDGRGATMGVTSTSAATISELLQKAAAAYAGGDAEGGRRLKAAADALDGTGQTGSGAAGAPGAAGSSGAAGSDPMGQMGQIMGQVGQQVGQLAQSITAPLQGLAQGLQQVPQQIMQGVQQAAQAAGASGVGVGKLPGVETSADDEIGERAERPEREEKDDPREKREAGPTADTEAQAGQSSAGRAPVEAPAPAQPAPTRPQVD